MDGFTGYIPLFNEGKRKDAWAVSRAHQNFVGGLFKSKVKSQNSKKTGINRSRKLSCLYKGSIVWAFFVKKHRHFTELDPAEFL